MRFSFWGCLCRARAVREMAERHIWEMSPVATPKAFRVCGVLKFSTSRKSSSSKYSGRVEAAAHQQHISNAVLQRPCGIPPPGSARPVLPESCLCKGFQFRKLVGHIVLYGVLCRREQGLRPILLVLQFSKAVFQRFMMSGAYSSRTVQRGTGRGNRASWVSDISK